MKIFFRHLTLCLIPLIGGFAAGNIFAASQPSCTSLVGPVLAAKCRGRMHEYQIWFQLGGTAAGGVMAAILGAALEARRRRTVSNHETHTEGVSA
ncbi:MAG TPA: hypothetical protein VLV45_05335 [Gemmatimonadales bacterium]|nr:hypothetical protein [Gemmatimonadales bacterium]